jgi:Trk K+ transport system NAD-binding subunit
MVSYLVQARLARRLRVHSIYEAQVASRADSPAYHTKHLEIALRLLREQRLAGLQHIGEVDLVALLRTGLPLDLGDERRLFAGELLSTSPFVGATIASSGRSLAGADTNIIGIIRGDATLSPGPQSVLTAGDRIVLVAGADALEDLRAHLAPW